MATPAQREDVTPWILPIMEREGEGRLPGRAAFPGHRCGHLTVSPKFTRPSAPAPTLLAVHGPYERRQEGIISVMLARTAREYGSSHAHLTTNPNTARSGEFSCERSVRSSALTRVGPSAAHALARSTEPGYTYHAARPQQTAHTPGSRRRADRCPRMRSGRRPSTAYGPPTSPSKSNPG